MNLSIAVSFLFTVSTGFSPVPKHTSHGWGYASSLKSALSDNGLETKVMEVLSIPLASLDIAPPDVEVDTPVNRINSRMTEIQRQMEIKDMTSIDLKVEDLNILHQDDDICVVNKPAGILSVPGKSDNPSLNQVVFDAVGCEMGRMDMMVVHRLGMDTSGVMVFAKTKEALRGMNALFRNRDVSRQYEALLVGHVEKDEGFIDLPLMRDYENPPYIRVSTTAHQRYLVDFTAEDIDKKILEAPKQSLTKYQVVAREEFNGLPVTRVTLTSISGRTHQLNVHCAAFGHPIVGDKMYGLNGEAAANGGLTAEELEELAYNPSRASIDLQERIAQAAADSNMCVHAKSIAFRHPVTEEEVSYSSEAPF